MLDHIKELGFLYATRAGITISIDDLIVPPGKRDFVENAQNEVVKVDQQYRDGAITNGERYNKVIAIWSDVTEKISDMMFTRNGKREKASHGFNPDSAHGRLRSSRIEAADPSACRYARIDGEAVG